MNKTQDTKEPLTAKKKEYMNDYFSKGGHMWSFPESFNPNDLNPLQSNDRFRLNAKNEYRNRSYLCV